MPADEWRDGNRIAAFGPHINLKSVPVPGPTDVRTRDTSTSSKTRRQSHILDRWAVRQAREMVGTIEQEAHGAEPSDMSVVSQPVSVPSSAGNAREFPQNVRASSLIQMWRELEAEAGVVRTPRTLSAATSNASDDSEGSVDFDTDLLHNISFATDRMIRVNGTGASESALASSDRKEGFRLPSGNLAVRLRSRRDIEELVERMRKDREMEIEAVGVRRVVSRFPHRGRIQSVLKLRFLRRDSAVQDQPQPRLRNRDANRSQSGSSILLLRERFDNRSQHNDNEIRIMDSTRNLGLQFTITSQGSTHSENQLNINNHQNHGLVSREDQESSQPETKPPHCQDKGTIKPDSPKSGAEEVPELNLMNSISIGTPEFILPHSRNEDTAEFILPRSASKDVLELNSPHSRSEGTPELCSPRSRREEIQGIEIPDGSCTPELCSPRSRREEIQGIEIPDGSWDERSMWLSNLASQGSIESSTSQDWQGETMTEEIEPYARQHGQDIGHIWIGSCSPSWRGWGVDGRGYHDFLEKFSDNIEIRELLERKMVSTSLASDFCDKMNRLILTFISRKDQLHHEDYSGEYGEQPIWRETYEFNNDDHIVSRSSLLPSSYQSLNYTDSWQYTSFTQNSSLNSREPESVHALRTEMAQMQQEINQLRKLVESCLEWQMKLQNSIKDEASHAAFQSVTVADTSDSSKLTPSSDNSCCICHETQIDSLLYRCGHMCTCFNCAHELQWNSGRCPICQSPIADVVRAYPNS